MQCQTNQLLNMQQTTRKGVFGTIKMNNIFNILLHTGIAMTVGMQLSEKDFKQVVKELPSKYKTQLLRIYTKHAKVLGPGKRRHLKNV